MATKEKVFGDIMKVQDIFISIIITMFLIGVVGFFRYQSMINPTGALVDVSASLSTLIESTFCTCLCFLVCIFAVKMAKRGVVDIYGLMPFLFTPLLLYLAGNTWASYFALITLTPS